MNIPAKLALGDEMFVDQPNMLASFLVQKSLGVSEPKMDFLLTLLFVMFVAMKKSGLSWPIISEDEQDRQMAITEGLALFMEGLSPEQFQQVVREQVSSHPEKELLAYVMGNIVDWLASVDPEESDKYVMMVAINMVNCLAFCKLQVDTRQWNRTQLSSREKGRGGRG